MMRSNHFTKRVILSPRTVQYHEPDSKPFRQKYKMKKRFQKKRLVKEAQLSSHLQSVSNEISSIFPLKDFCFDVLSEDFPDTNFFCCNSIGSFETKSTSELPFQIPIDWNGIPKCIDPAAGELQLDRAKRKRDQVQSLILRTEFEISLLLNQKNNALSRFCDPFTVVEFGAGSGHVGLVLAYRNPHIQVVLAERKEYSTTVARYRIHTCGLKNVRVHCGDVRELSPSYRPPPPLSSNTSSSSFSSIPSEDSQNKVKQDEIKNKDKFTEIESNETESSTSSPSSSSFDPTFIKDKVLNDESNSNPKSDTDSMSELVSLELIPPLPPIKDLRVSRDNANYPSKNNNLNKNNNKKNITIINEEGGGKEEEVEGDEKENKEKKRGEETNTDESSEQCFGFDPLPTEVLSQYSLYLPHLPPPPPSTTTPTPTTATPTPLLTPPFTFHYGIGLHTCGSLSDLALDLCLEQRASFSLTPCCYGQITSPPPKYIDQEDPTTRQAVVFTSGWEKEEEMRAQRSKKLLGTFSEEALRSLTQGADFCVGCKNQNQSSSSSTSLSSNRKDRVQIEGNDQDPSSSSSDPPPPPPPFGSQQAQFLKCKRCMRVVDLDRGLRVCERYPEGEGERGKGVKGQSDFEEGKEEVEDRKIGIEGKEDERQMINTQRMSQEEKKKESTKGREEMNDTDHVHGYYSCALSSLRPFGCSPKNNLLIGRFIHSFLPSFLPSLHSVNQLVSYSSE